MKTVIEIAMCYELKKQLLSISYSYYDGKIDNGNLTRLLNVGGFDYIKKLSDSGWLFVIEIEIDTSDYFDVDLFMEIVDLLEYNCFWYNSTIENIITRYKFRLELLANIV